MVFITDDRKEDWWQISYKEPARPHPDLVKEFFDCTGIRILIINADQFLREAKDRKILPDLNENTINEVKDVRISEEKEGKLFKYWDWKSFEGLRNDLNHNQNFIRIYDNLEDRINPLIEHHSYPDNYLLLLSNILASDKKTRLEDFDAPKFLKLLESWNNRNKKNDGVDELDGSLVPA